MQLKVGFPWWMQRALSPAALLWLPFIFTFNPALQHDPHGACGPRTSLGGSEPSIVCKEALPGQVTRSHDSCFLWFPPWSFILTIVIYSDVWSSAHSKPARWTWPGFPVSFSQRWVTQEDRSVPTQVLSGDSPPFMIQDQVPLRLSPLGGQ